MRIDADEYQRVLGEELRKLRRRKGWTRKQLGERLDIDISLQTLATYELGTRQCSVVRLVELCVAMEEAPHELLARVHGRIMASEPGRVKLNLTRVIAGGEAELEPLRRWAQDRLGQAGDPSAREVQLDRAAIEWLARLCGLPSSDLLARLRRFSAVDDQGSSPRTP